MFDKWMKDYGRAFKKEDDIKFKVEETGDAVPKEPVVEEPIVKTEVRSDMVGGAMKLKMLHPTKYEDVSMIADYFLDGYTVVLNIAGMEPATLRRMYDFLNGVTYSKDGVINRVDDTDTFILTPSDVDVSGEKKN